MNADVQINDKPRKLSDVDFTPSGEVFPSPEDWRDQVIYFLLVDRFNNPDKLFSEEKPQNRKKEGVAGEVSAFNGKQNSSAYVSIISIFRLLSR